MRSSAQPQTTSFNQNLMRSPEPTNSIRRPSSIDRGRSGTSNNQLELPYVDPQARFSISYVPGMSEHVVNTGKTLPEAQLKVVLLACEVERLNTLNYNLVKENEILKSQTKKTDREADLETKLAIVLAENEKLNQIVEELHSVYARERESLGHEDYERKIGELMQDLEDWKQKCNRLEGANSTNPAELKTIQELQKERELLKEQLGRASRDAEALRSRLGAMVPAGPADSKVLQQQISNLQVENDKLRSELETMKLKYGNADALQQRLNQYDAKLRVLLAENDKLNNLLAEKARELQSLQANVRQAPQGEVAKRSAVPTASPSHGLRDAEEKLNRVTSENDRLNNLVIELRTENEQLRKQGGQGVDPTLNRRIDQLTLQVNGLLDENRKLNDALSDKSRAHAAENDRLNGLIFELRSENDRLKRGDPRYDNISSQTGHLLEENRKLNEAFNDRLKEIDTLRIRIRDLESGSGVVHDLRDKVVMITSENERLNGLIVELRADNERLRRQLNESNGGSQRIEILSAQINTLLEDNRRLNNLAADRLRETEGLKARINDMETRSPPGSSEYKRKINTLTTDSERLNSTLYELQTENDKLKRQLNDALQGNQRINQLTVQINGLLDDNRKLNDLATDRLREIDALKAKIRDMETRSPPGSSEYKRKINLLTTDSEKLNTHMVELQNDNERLTRQLNEAVQANQRISQLTGQINNLLDENKRLNDLAVDRSREIEGLRARVADIETRSPPGSSEYKKKIGLLTTDSERLNAHVYELQAENDRLKRQLNEANQGNQRITVQVNGLLEENRRLNDLVADRSRDNDALRSKIRDMETRSPPGSSEYKRKINSLTTDSERLNAHLAELEAENDRLSRQLNEALQGNQRINQLTGQINGLLEENKRLNDLVGDRSRDNEGLRAKIRDMETRSPPGSSEYKRKINSLTTDSERLGAHLAELEAENDRLSRQLNDALQGNQRVSQLSIQINTLLEENKRLNELATREHAENDRLRRRVTELESGTGVNREFQDRIVLAATENERLNSIIVDLRRQLDATVSTTRIDQLNLQINSLLEENKRLNSVLLSKSAEVDTLRRRVNDLENNAANHELRDRVAVLTRENERLSVVIVELRSETDRLKRQLSEPLQGGARVEQLSIQINSLLDENRRLNDLVVERTSQIDRLKRMMVEVEAGATTINDLKGKIVLISSENERLSHLVVELRAEADRLRLQPTDTLRSSHFNLQISTLQDENRKLTAALADKTLEIERLRKNEGASVVITELRDKLLVASHENQRLSTLVLELRADNDRLKLTPAPVTTVVSHTDTLRIEQLNSQINGLLVENKKLNDTLVTLRAENDRLRLVPAPVTTVVSHTDTLRIEQLTSQINGLLVENQKLNDTLLSLRAENDRLRLTPAPVTTVVSHTDTLRIEQLNSQINGLLVENKKLNDTLVSLRAENDRLRLVPAPVTTVVSHTDTLRIEQLNTQINGLLVENKKLNDTLVTLRAENDRLRLAPAPAPVTVLTTHHDTTKVDQLTVQINTLLAENQKINDACDEFRRRVAMLESSNHSLTVENDKLRSGSSVKVTTHHQEYENTGLKNQVASMAAEIERLTALLNTKHRDEEIVQVRKQDEGAKKSRQVEEPAAKSNDQAVVITGLEARIKFLDGEVHRLNHLLDEKDKELAGWRAKSGEYDFTRQENERLSRLLTERLTEIEHLKSHSHHEIDTKTAIDAEYKKLLDAQIAEANARFENERQTHEARVHDLMSHMRELDEKIHVLSVDNDRLTAANDQTKNEVTSWKHKYEAFEKQKAVDIESLKAEYERRIRESPTRKGMSQQVIDLEDKVTHLNNEIDRQKNLLNKAYSELDDWKKKYGDLEKQRIQEIEELRQQFDHFKKTNIEAKELQVKFNAERTAYETQIMQQQQKINDLEAQIQLITNENERLTKLSLTRLEELEDIKRQHGGLKASQSLEVTQLRAQLETFKASQHDVQQLAIKYSAEKAADQSQIKQLRQVNDNYKAEIDKLYALLEQRKSDFASLSKQNEELVQSYQRLNEQLTGVSTSGVSSKERLEMMEKELQSLEMSRDEYRKQAQRNSIDLTRKNRELVDKLQELDILKMKYEEALANYQALNSRLFERLSHDRR